jgi:hypothetical protein
LLLALLLVSCSGDPPVDGVADDSQASDTTDPQQSVQQQAAQAQSAQPQSVQLPLSTSAPVPLKRVASAHLQAVQRGLQQRLSHSTQGLSERRGPDGSRRVSLEGRFQHVLIVNQDEQGQSHVMCVDTPEGVAAALGNGPPTP